MLMEDIKIYVIVSNQKPNFLFERIEDYSSMRGYLAKAHPITHIDSRNTLRSRCTSSQSKKRWISSKHTKSMALSSKTYRKRDLNEKRCPNNILKIMVMSSLIYTA